MNIEARKILLAQRLFKVQQESILDKIESLLNQKIQLTAEEKNAIDEGLESLEKGHSVPHDKVMERAQKKYPTLYK